MSAKEMFKQLDFNNTLKNQCLLLYERYSENSSGFYSEVINSHLNDKTLSIINVEEVTMPLLRAINKQIEELGWLDD